MSKCTHTLFVIPIFVVALSIVCTRARSKLLYWLITVCKISFCLFVAATADADGNNFLVLLINHFLLFVLYS